MYKVIRLWALMGGALLILIVLITAVNAAGFTANFIARNWGGTVSGLPGYEDAVTLLVGVAAMAMFPYCQAVRGHASVDLVMQHAPQWAAKGVELVSTIVTALVVALLCYFLVMGALEVKSDAVETAVLAWPVWIFMALCIPSCLLWIIAALAPPCGEGVLVEKPHLEHSNGS